MQLAKTSINWQEAIEIYNSERVDLRPKTLHLYILAVRRFSAFIGIPVETTTRIHVLRYLENYLSPKAYNLNLSALSSFFHSVSENYRIPDPTEGLRKKKVFTLPEPRILTHDEYRRIVGVCGGYKHNKTRDTAVFLANTGLRIDELTHLKPSDLNARNEIKVVGKGGKIRFVPLNQTALQLAAKHHLNFSKSDSTTRNSFKNLSEQLHIVPHFTPHSLRHYFATSLLEKGVSIESVSKILGHSDIRTTISFYYHPSDLAASVALLEPPELPESG
jgi:site-specific recombinase XerD